MNSANDFWLEVHRLAVAYDAEGLTPEDRATNIIEQFREMPRLAQRELLCDLLRVTNHCPDLYSLAVSATNEQVTGGQRKRRIG